ncbi:hypothetical protein ACFYW1_23650 [Streptomyces sp. NPDC002669]|uniref:hypothetical protein n=1 Tax=Streptomyces sp. NPDC002669 TaxID=3364658 RepID=UPI00367D1176
MSSSGGVISGSVPDFEPGFRTETPFGLRTGSITGTTGDVVFGTATDEATVNAGTGLVVPTAGNCAGILNSGDSIRCSAAYGVDFS